MFGAEKIKKKEVFKYTKTMAENMELMAKYHKGNTTANDSAFTHQYIILP